MKFDIFGGCTSRDLFNFANAYGSVNNYFARTSLVSQYTSRVKSLETMSVDTGSNFQNKMVLNDFKKSFRQYFENDSPKGDYFILDLLVERLAILRYQTGYITRTVEFKRSKCNIGPEKRLSKDEHRELFFKIAPNLAQDLKIYKKVFLNKALLCTKYISNDEKIVEFDNLAEIAATNEFLNSLYDILENTIENVEVVEFSDFCAWEGHRWGLSPFHYEDEFYHLFNKRVKNLILSSES